MQSWPRAAGKTDGEACAEARCAFLDWDSEFFGCRIASVRGQRLSKRQAFEIDEWCRASRIDCLYFLADLEDPETIRLAEEYLFRLVDIRVTLTSNLVDVSEIRSGAGRIRPGRQEDISALRKIARSNHTSSRFYFDGKFPTERCQSLYETWIEKSCSGYADAVFVPELNGEPVGYISCHLKPDGTGSIGLAGLASEARGKEVGTELVQAAQRWFVEKNVKQVSVVTQGRNVAAQRLYQRCGFSTQSLQLWYHRWFTKGDQ